MKSWLLTCGILTVLVCNVISQSNQTPTTPPSTTSPSPQTGTGGRQTTIQDQRRIDAAFDNLRSLEIPQNAGMTAENILREVIHPLYRKPGKKELKNLWPSQSLLTRYEKFLKQPGTGLFKLSADSACAANAQVLVATESCLSNNVPGAGTAYSFREKSHRLLHLSDLVLEKNVIRTGSLLQQGIMVRLGDIDLETASDQTAGLRYLIEFEPITDKAAMLSFEEKLSKGIKADGFTYAYGLYIEDQATFALRSIAYRGKFMRSVSGVKYNEMSLDKRKDIVVVFRVVEKDSNGDVTILWKEISRKDSPVIKLDEKDQ